MILNTAETDAVQIKGLLSDILGIPSYLSLERMGGLTNRTYKVIVSEQKSYVIRIPGEGTEALINRANEKISTHLACKLGLDANLIYFGRNGEKISEYIEDAQTLSPSTFRKEENINKAARVLFRLHNCAESTGVPFDVFDMAASYENIINTNCIALYDDYPTVKACVLSIKQDIDQYSVALVPCHNDPLCENWLLDSSGRIYLIDWEYAGMNDAMWDLADLSIEAALSKQQDDFLLRSYFDRKPTTKEYMRFQANKLYLDYLWTLWAKARVPFAGEAMEVYAYERYIRLKKNVSCFQQRTLFIGEGT